MLKNLLIKLSRSLLAPVVGVAGLTLPAAAQLTVPLPRQPGVADTLPSVQVIGYGASEKRGGCGGVPCSLVTRSFKEDFFYPYTTIQPILSQAAGVQVTPNSGAPGDWATVRIRGSGLRGADQPLYLLDGLPALNADFAPVQAAPPAVYAWGEGAQVSAAAPNPLLFVPPQEVESITVLRGGLATARYGSQGANGVVLITTRRGGISGSRQAPRLHYETFGGVQQVRQRPALLDAQQYAALANEVWRAAGSQGAPPFRAATLGSLGSGTDWQRELFRPALLQNHALSLAGSTTRTRYLASANYLDQSGVVLNSKLRRYGLRLNLDYAATPTLRLWLNAAGAAIDRTLPPAETVPTALLAPPTVPAYTSGEPTVTNAGGVPPPGYAVPFFNPIAQAQAAATTDATRRLLAQAGAVWKFAPSLRLEANLSHEQVTTEATNRTLTAAFGAAAQPVAREQVLTTQRLGTTNAQTSLFYQQPAGSRHLLSGEVTLLAQHLRRTQQQTYLLANSFLGNTTSSDEYPLTVLSALATGTYSFDQRLALTALLRAERSRAAVVGVGSAGTVQVYPALEASWDAGRESFLQGSRLVTGLRLSASVGQSSNGSIAAAYFPSGPAALPSVAPQGLMVPQLARTTQVNADVNLTLFGGRLSVQPAFYSHYTAHANVAQVLLVAGSLGLTSPELTTRDVDVRNQGIELAVASYLSLTDGKFNLTTRLAAAHNQQTIVAIADAGAVPGLVVGEGLHPYYGWQRTGLSSTGAPQYRDTNGDGTITTADASYFGTGIPSWLLTLTQQAKLGRWALQAQFDVLLGYQLLSPVLARLDYPAATTNGSQRLLDRWTPAHRSTEVPPASFYGQPALYDNHAPESASHLRLSQLMLSYYVRPEGLHVLQVWAGVQNLFVLTSYRGFDPNVSSGGSQGQLAGYDASQYPVPRTWLLGVRASL